MREAPSRGVVRTLSRVVLRAGTLEPLGALRLALLAGRRPRPGDGLKGRAGDLVSRLLSIAVVMWLIGTVELTSTGSIYPQNNFSSC